MELEQRVKALEYETKILKNEVQKVLLGIQEQILVHYYPTLRLSDSQPPEHPIVPATVASRTTQDTSALVTEEMQVPEGIDPSRVKKVSLDVEPALVKRVSLDQVRTVSDPASPPTAEFPKSDPAAMVKQLQWAMESAGKIGPEAVTKLIKVCAVRGAIPKEMEAVMITAAQSNNSTATMPADPYGKVRVLLKLQSLTQLESNGDELLSMIEEAENG